MRICYEQIYRRWPVPSGLTTVDSQPNHLLPPGLWFRYAGVLCWQWELDRLHEGCRVPNRIPRFVVQKFQPGSNIQDEPYGHLINFRILVPRWICWDKWMYKHVLNRVAWNFGIQTNRVHWEWPANFWYIFFSVFLGCWHEFAIVYDLNFLGAIQKGLGCLVISGS